ncbi:MAG TPA: GNAT family N-acetyltransferase [Usitatibacter sp.]|nr:GNAT family N-acetyltransferase [Usitatibacter sp.]
MSLRLAAEADFPALHRLRMSVRENVLSDPRAVTLDDYRAMLAAGGRGWVHETGGAPDGFAIVDVLRCNVWALFVAPGREGRGIGRALHDAMLDWYFGTGAASLWLSTDGGTRAERFYRRAGWRHAGERRGEQRFEMTAAEWAALRASRPR